MVARNATNAQSTASSRRKASRTSATSVDEAQSESPSLRERLRLLYLGKSETAHRFRYGLLVFDISTILFIIGTSFMARAPWLEWFDLIFGLLILADFCARLYVSPHPIREFAHPSTWADMHGKHHSRASLSLGLIASGGRWSSTGIGSTRYGEGCSRTQFA